MSVSRWLTDSRGAGTGARGFAEHDQPTEPTGRPGFTAPLRVVDLVRISRCSRQRGILLAFADARVACRDGHVSVYGY